MSNLCSKPPFLIINLMSVITYLVLLLSFSFVETKSNLVPLSSSCEPSPKACDVTHSPVIAVTLLEIRAIQTDER